MYALCQIWLKLVSEKKLIMLKISIPQQAMDKFWSAELITENFFWQKNTQFEVKLFVYGLHNILE